tara:strand:+ start:55 stop:249 length:195 start_codon:yes stop_codon:yes gene_type:complete
MSQFGFNLHDEVTIKISGEKGHIKSRAEHTTSDSNYRVMYKAADGRAVENWFDDAELELTSAKA